MTWTYQGNPSANNRDAVRFLCGDTNEADQLITDEEIAYLVANQPGNLAAAAAACDAIAAKLARKEGSVSRRSGSISTSGAQAYATRAKELRRQASMSSEWFFGGQTKSGKETLKSDTDAVQPHFAVGQDDHPGRHDDDGGHC